MEIFFQDPGEIPLPPDEVRIRELKTEPWPDGRRVGVYLEVDPFQIRPNFDLVVTDARGQERGTVSIIESMTRKMELTMHIQGSETDGEYTLSAALFFVERSQEEDPEALSQEPHIVDRAERKFSIGIEQENK